MTAFTFTVEQLKTAPIEVRHWILAQIEADMRAVAAAPVTPPAAHTVGLAACTPEEAARLFQMIKDDFAAVQVFVALGREAPMANTDPGLRALRLAEIVRHTQLDANRLVACLNLINAAFRQIRQEPDCALFGFDDSYHVYLHETTYRSVRAVWEQLIGTVRETPSASDGVELPVSDFLPRRVGPSEDVAAHRAV